MKRLLSSLFCLMICFSIFAFCGGTVYYTGDVGPYMTQGQTNCPEGVATVLISIDHGGECTVFGNMQ